MEWLTDPQIWISLITLTVLEIVLGIDNIIFISILAAKLPEGEQKKARTIGLLLALVTRVLLLSFVFLLAHFEKPLFQLLGHDISGRSLVMIVGGLFLLTKSVREIHLSLEGQEHAPASKSPGALANIIAQIVVIDIVFSLDSVITAVGLGPNIGVMIAAVIFAMIVMLAASGAISAFVNKHPTIKMLALSFLILVGVMLVADGFGHHIEKGYIYFAMAFSFAVEMLNIRARKKRGDVLPPIELRRSM
jgi:predicted tellurium resistance membrane protein TerC